jgi:hypothetical protein
LVVLFTIAKVDVDVLSPLPDASEKDVRNQSRLVMLECHLGPEPGLSEPRMDKIGEWYFDGFANGVGVKKESNGIYLCTTNFMI